MGYIHGIHIQPYIAAPWILWDRAFPCHLTVTHTPNPLNIDHSCIEKQLVVSIQMDLVNKGNHGLDIGKSSPFMALILQVSEILWPLPRWMVSRDPQCRKKPISDSGTALCAPNTYHFYIDLAYFPVRKGLNSQTNGVTLPSCFCQSALRGPC